MFCNRFSNRGTPPGKPGLWKTVELERGTPAEWRKLLRAHKCRAGDQASRLLEQVPLRSEKVSLNLAKCSVGDLGFPENEDLEHICAKAQELGLGACPDDLAVKLRVEYLNQPNHEVLKVAMRPMVLDKSQLIFTLSRYFSQFWVGVSPELPGIRYSPKCQFVWVLL